jgi:AhpD family alkylhydroperoxidase
VPRDLRASFITVSDPIAELKEVRAMGEMKEAMQDVKRAMGELNRQVPEEMKGFSEFMGAVLKPGQLDLKTKELIALGMALTARCKYCIGIHTEKALVAGASPAEIWEVATVAIMMGGGPALTYVAELRKALDEFLPPAKPA